MLVSQIMALLGLLLAFGVPQVTVDKVEGILKNTNPIVATTTTSIQITIPQTNTSPQMPVFGSTLQTEPINVLPQPVVSTPQSIEITQIGTAVAQKSGVKFSFKPLLSDSTVDKTAKVFVTSTAPWWFPHGVTICNEECYASFDTPIDVFSGVGTPENPGNYTMTATWGNVSTTVDVIVK